MENYRDSAQLYAVMKSPGWAVIEKRFNDAVEVVKNEAFAPGAGLEALHAAKGAIRVRDLVLTSIQQDANPQADS